MEGGREGCTYIHDCGGVERKINGSRVHLGKAGSKEGYRRKEKQSMCACVCGYQLHSTLVQYSLIAEKFQLRERVLKKWSSSQCETRLAGSKYVNMYVRTYFSDTVVPYDTHDQLYYTIHPKFENTYEKNVVTRFLLMRIHGHFQY